MPLYELVFFNKEGRGEVIRLLFKVAGVEFIDTRIEYEEWLKNKDSIDPIFGKLPMLKIDDQSFCQSHSIARHLAEKFGMAGKTDLEKLRADMTVHCCEDLITCITRLVQESDEEKKKLLEAKFRNEELNTFMSNFEKILKQNKDGDGFFVGDSITWADLNFFHYLTFVQSHGGVEIPSFISTYPKLKALLERIEKVPQIAAWLAVRPPESH